MERLTTNYHFEEDKKLLEEMKNTFLACPAAVKYIHSLKIPEEKIDEEIVKIYDFVTDLNYCKRCPGINMCQKATPGLCTKIVYEDGVVSRELVPCKEYLKNVKFKSQFLVRDFPDEWLNSSFKTLDHTAVRKEILESYKNYEKDLSQDWIYIMGEAGTGRTFVAATISLTAARGEKGPIAFIDTPSRFSELNTKKNDTAFFNSQMEKYLTVPILVIDDLGNEYKNDFVRESILTPILSQRAKKHLLTIITSDFDINDIALMYQTSAASKPKAEQIKRILKRMCKKEFNLGDLSVY